MNNLRLGPLLVLLSWYSAAAPAQGPASGELVVFTAAVDIDLDGAELGGIHVIRPDGTGLRKLTSFQTVLLNWEEHGLNLPDDHPAVSPDGRKIVFTSNRAGGFNWELYLMDINGSNVQRLTNAPGLDIEPVFSPDGSKIAFASERFGDLDICVLDLATLAVTRLTSSPFEEIEPAWSPDGSRIAFARVQGNDEKDVFVVRTDGTNLQQLTFAPGEDHDPSFAPNGLRLAITSERAFSPPYGDVWTIDAQNGGNGINLTTDQSFGSGDPSFSPSGTRIAYFHSTLPVITAPQRLFVMNQNGSGKQQMPPQGFLNIHPNWGIVRDTDLDGRADYLENSNRSYSGRDFGRDHANARFGSAIALADLTRDGFLDLAIGAPGGEVTFLADAGEVLLGRGCEFGLDFRLFGIAGPGLAQRRIDTRFFGVAPVAGGRFGATMVAGDFNGDGFRDLAIGAPGQGKVFVLEGASAPFQVLSGSADFGAALAVGDFDGNGVDDLAVGAPHALRPTANSSATVVAGAVHVFRGFVGAGLATVAQTFDQNGLPDPLLLGRVESGDEFGAALAAGDFNGDGADDLCVGVPGEDAFHLGNVGAIHVIPGATGQTLRLAQAIARDGRALPAPHSGWFASARFGDVLATGDFNDDLLDLHDLVVGIPRQRVGTLDEAGIVAVFAASLGSALLGGAQVFAAADLGATDAAFAHFGRTLARGDFGGDGIDDLAIAAPRASIGGTAAAGRVHLVHGARGSNTNCQFCAPNTVLNLGAGGLLAATAQLLIAPQVGVPTVPGAQFGGSSLLPAANALAVGDLDRDGQDDLFVGTPSIAVGGAVAAGLVGVRYGIGVGTFDLQPATACLPTGNTVPVTLTWTHPGVWRDMATMDLRLRSAGEVPLWLRVDPKRQVVAIFEPAHGRFGPERTLGGPGVIAGSWGQLRLSQSSVQGSGPEGREVTLHLALRFHRRIAGHTYAVEVTGTDETAHAQGFEAAGSWQIRHH